MASIDGIKRRLKEYRPAVQSAFIVYVTPRESPVTDVDEQFEIRTVTSPDDPLLPKICEKWQLPVAKASLAKGEWDILVALVDGEPVGRIWETFATEKRRFAGIPLVRLAADEAFMFDLFVTREYRRSNIGMTMADYFFRKYAPGGDIRYVYGFISYENAPSILWHHSIGFNIVQTINYLAIGPRIKWRIPFSDNPRFGPLSRKGRHTDPDRDLFGTSLFPQ